MTKNGIFLSLILALLGATYVWLFTDWFRTQTIQIIPSIRPDRASRIQRADDTEVYPVAFKFNKPCRLTDVKVVVASDLATNRFAVPLWHMVGDAESRPVDAIVYGGLIKGMKPKVARSKPQALDPDVPYTLLIEAGSVKGRTNFFTKAVIAR